MTRITDHRFLILLAALLFAGALWGSAQSANTWLWAGAALVPLAALAFIQSEKRQIRGYWPVLILPALLAAQLIPGYFASAAPAATLFELARIIVYLAVFGSLYVVSREHANSEWLLLMIPLVFGCVEAAMGILQRSGSGLAGVGTFANHSHFGGFMAILLPVAIVFAIAQRQILAYSVPLVMFVALLFSISRMAFAAGVLAILAMIMIKTKKIRIGAAALALILVASFLIAPKGWTKRFERLSTYKGLSRDAEFGLWRDTTHLIAAHPLLGSGAGSYEIAFTPFNSNPKPWPVIHADNEYLELLAEVGIVGTACALALFGFAIYRCFQAGVSGNPAALGCMASILVLLLHSIFEFQMHIPANVLAVCWIAGVGCGIAGREPGYRFTKFDSRLESTFEFVHSPELAFNSRKET